VIPQGQRGQVPTFNCAVANQVFLRNFCDSKFFEKELGSAQHSIRTFESFYDSQTTSINTNSRLNKGLLRPTSANHPQRTAKVRSWLEYGLILRENYGKN